MIPHDASSPESRPQASDTALLAPFPLFPCSLGQSGDIPSSHVLWRLPSPSQLSCNRLPLNRSGGEHAELPGCGPWEAAQMLWTCSLVAGQVCAAPEPMHPLSSENLGHSLNLRSLCFFICERGIFLPPKKVCQEVKLEPVVGLEVGLARRGRGHQGGQPFSGVGPFLTPTQVCSNRG